MLCNKFVHFGYIKCYVTNLFDFIKFNTAQNCQNTSKKSNNPSNHCMVGNIFKTSLLIVVHLQVGEVNNG